MRASVPVGATKKAVVHRHTSCRSTPAYAAPKLHTGTAAEALSRREHPARAVKNPATRLPSRVSRSQPGLTAWRRPRHATFRVSVPKGNPAHRGIAAEKPPRAGRRADPCRPAPSGSLEGQLAGRHRRLLGGISGCVTSRQSAPALMMSGARAHHVAAQLDH